MILLVEIKRSLCLKIVKRRSPLNYYLSKTLIEMLYGLQYSIPKN